EDYRKLDRVYLPLDLLKARGTDIRALAWTRTCPELRLCLDDICDRVEALLAKSERLARQVQQARLGLEIAVIQRLAERIVHLLRVNDPLGGRVHLSMLESAGFAVLGAARVGTRRL